MKRESIVFLLGLLVIVTPFLGVPNLWKQIAYMVMGAMLALMGYQLRRQAYLRSIEQTSGERKTDMFVENTRPTPPVAAESAPVKTEEITVFPESEPHDATVSPKRRSRTTRTPRATIRATRRTRAKETVEG